MEKDTISALGFISLFADDLTEKELATHEFARVVAVHKESYLVSKAQGTVFAELAGKLFYSAQSSLDLPTVGDWVCVDFFDDDTLAIIHRVLPRKTLLKRKAVGKQVDFQLIAANIDVAFIMQSANANFNIRRLERYLVMVNESGITPIILLSKSDLLLNDKINQLKNEITAIAPQVKLIEFSNLSGKNLELIKAHLLAGQSYCLLGSSGVGKTTLLNSLVEEQRFETQSVSKKDSKGRHTTTRRELISLDNGAMIIDTPGMRELGNIAVDDGLDETFSEIIELSQQCKFNNCHHSNEQGCAILAAIDNGSIEESRYNSYLKMKNESDFYAMSYVEKKQKDKNFGKQIKSALTSKRAKKHNR